MTNNDDFAKAARAEILSRLGHEAQRFDGGKRVTAFVGGAEWARDHLTAQEPDDETQEWENEVAAALPERYDGDEDQRDIILRAVQDMAVRETQGPTDDEVEAARKGVHDHSIVTEYYRDGEVRWQGCTTCDVEIRDYDEQERHEVRAVLSAARDTRIGDGA